MTYTAAAVVVDNYEARAQFARAETDTVSRPRLLRGLLRTAEHVTEFPCGAGHFLADYAATGAETTLIDGNCAMLATAIKHAADIGLPADRVHAQIGYVQELDPLVGVDLAVMPNAALNQLACQTPLIELLSAIRRSLQPGVDLLAQVMCIHPGGWVETTDSYDPARQHGVWFADRYFNPTRASGAVLRRRRQHRHDRGNGAGQVHVDFDYVDSFGSSLHTTSVGLCLFSAEELATTLVTTGFSHIRFLPGHGGLSEILAQVDSSDLR